MARNNIKLLTDDELEYFKSKYYFELDGDDVVVKLTNRDKFTRHNRYQSFSINCKELRKITFTADAIDIWSKLMDTTPYTLVDVQQALNMLLLTYQEITLDSVLRVLIKGHVKIQNT